MTEAPLLRPGRDDDAAGFIALIDACWSEYPGCILDVDAEEPQLRALASYFNSQGGMLVAAVAGGRIVGMAASRPLPGAAGVWEICKVYVDATLRGTGLAHRLLDRVEDHARAGGAQTLRLWSDSRFDRAHRFYERRGFVRDGPDRVLNDISNTTELAFARPLGATGADLARGQRRGWVAGG